MRTLPGTDGLESGLVEEPGFFDDLALTTAAPHYGDVAQLVERLPCKQEVAGSSPAVSTIPAAILPPQKGLPPPHHADVAQWQRRQP